MAEAIRTGDLSRARAAGVRTDELALLELVETLTRSAHRITDEQVQSVRDKGWSDEQIFEAIWVGAAYCYLNRIVDVYLG